MAGSGLPGALLAPVQLVSLPRLGSSAGHRRPGSWACRKPREGGSPGESDRPPAPLPPGLGQKAWSFRAGRGPGSAQGQQGQGGGK